MTDKEKAIVMAYTGACMLSGDKFEIFHGYVENIIGRPVYTHEMGIEAVADEIKEKAKADFIALCAEQEPCEDCISRQAVLDYIYNDLGLGDEENGKDVERQMELDSSYRYIKSLPSVNPQPETGHWIKTISENGITSAVRCSECGFEDNRYMLFRYCPSCGARMIEPQESEASDAGSN